MDAARRQRAYVRVQGPDAVDYLNRILSNDVPDSGSVDALLLTAKARVIAHAEAGFTSNVPLSFLEQDDALLATHGDGEVLAPDHGYPLRLVIPGKYFWKSAKWLRGIELSSIDQPGFWERYGYHNDADPWAEQRYGF